MTTQDQETIAALKAREAVAVDLLTRMKSQVGQSSRLALEVDAFLAHKAAPAPVRYCNHAAHAAFGYSVCPDCSPDKFAGSAMAS
jgi:hypothetical protein